MKKRAGNRIVAFLMAMLMVVSSMGGSSLTAYAKETLSDAAVVAGEQPTVEETSEVVSGNMVSDNTVSDNMVSDNEVPDKEVSGNTVSDNKVPDITVSDNTVSENVVPGELAYTGMYAGSSLCIYAEKMAEAGMEFNDANLIAIMEYWSNQSVTVERVEIIYPNMAGVVSKEVWNAMVQVQEANYPEIEVCFPNTAGDCVFGWDFEEVTETASDVVLNMDWTINEEGKGVVVSFTNVVFPARFANISVSVGTEYDYYSQFCIAFAEGDQAVLYDASGDIVLTTSATSYIENGYDCAFSVNGVQALTAGANYTVNNKKFTGRLEENLYGIVSLNFYPGDWETDEELAEMIRANKGLGVHKVWITEDVTGNTRTVSSDVINAAIEILSPLPEGHSQDEPSVNLFTSDSGLDIIISGPMGTVAGETVEFSMDVSVSGNEAKVKKNSPAINASSVVMRLDFDEETLPDPLSAIYSITDGRKQLYVGENRIQAGYYNTQGENSFTVNNVKSLENNTWYDIIDPVGNIPNDVPGQIRVDSYDGARTLDFHAEEIGKDALAKGDIATALVYYQEQISAGEMEPFRYIYIRQKNTDKDIIYKDDFNFLRGLMESDVPNTTGLHYYYEEPTTISGSKVTNSEQWQFYNPVAATADMDVSNVSVKALKNSVKIQFPANTYPSDYVRYSRILDGRIDTAKDLLASFHNQTANSSSDFRIFSNPEKFEEVYFSTCIFDEYTYSGITEYSLNIGWVEKLGTKEYTMVKYLQDDPLYIGETRQLEPTFTPDKGSAVNWRNITSRATVDKNGLLTPTTEGTAMYAVSYKLDGEWTIDYWHATVSKKLLSMKFADVSVAKPLNMEVGATEQLKLSFYPTGTTPAAGDLEWFVGCVNDNSVSANNIELVTDANGNPTGEIKAVSEGVAVITVTHKADANLCAKAKIVVQSDLNAEMQAKAAALGELYAIINIDKTLADIELPEESGFTWVDKTISLESVNVYKDVAFSAIYTSKDGRTAYTRLPVNLLTVGPELQVYDSEFYYTDKELILEDADRVYMNCYLINQYGYFVDEDILPERLNARNMSVDIVVTSNPKDIVVESDDKDAAEWMFVANASESGKKTITFEAVAVHNETKKVTVLGKEVMTVTVPKNPVMNWDTMDVCKVVNNNDESIADISFLGEKGEFVFAQKKDAFFDLTIKSLDTKVCKLVKQHSPVEQGDYKVVRVEYECLAGGVAQISVTAKDELKSNTVYMFDVRDIMPRVLASAVTIDVNKVEAQQYGVLRWILSPDTTILNGKDNLLLGENEGKFNIDGVAGDDVKVYMTSETRDDIELVVELINAAIKKGKYQVNVAVPVYADEKTEEFNTTVTINVTDNKPKVIAKQTKMVNLFYTDEESYGYFTLTPPTGSAISSVTLEAPAKKACDFTIMEADAPNTYAVKLTDMSSLGKNKAGVLKVALDNYRKPVELKVTIKTEKKKPTLLLSQKLDALYPNYTSDRISELYLIDKATGKKFNEIHTVEYKAGKEYNAVSDDGSTVKGTKNTYTVTKTAESISFELNEGSVAQTTDKFSLKVRGTNWKESIPVSYSIKVETARPQLSLSTKNVNLNINEKLYKQEVMYVDLGLKGTVGGEDSFGKVYIYELGTAAQKSEMQKWINVSYEDGRLKIAVEDIEGMTKSSYTYKYSIEVQGKDNAYYIWDTLTVKLTNTAPAKCIAVSSKGSLDVLDRSKYIAYTPKLKNVHGTVVDGKLTGTDADLFDCKFENGVLKVALVSDETYSTKAKYSVKPVFTVQNADGERCELSIEKNQTIKVKQGKPKLKADKVTLYRDRQYYVSVPVSATLNGKAVEIEAVELVNFTNDVSAEYEQGRIYLYGAGIDKMNASGKTYSIKLNVYYADRASNEKPASLTVNLTIK